MANGSLMKVESIAECLSWSILQYFWPALSEKRSWKTIFGLFLSGCLRQVLMNLNKCSFEWFNHESITLKEKSDQDS